MKMQVESKKVDEAMTRAASRLKNMLRCIWGESDERYAPLAEHLSQAVWRMAVQLYGDDHVIGGPTVKIVDVSNERLSLLVNGVMGRVLTWIDAAFSIKHQCEAIKSMAGTIVWDIRKDVLDNVCGMSDEKK